MAKKAIVLLAEGFEEVEAVTPVDYLRRAGVEVTLAALGACGAGLVVKGAHGIGVSADLSFEDLTGQGKASAAFWDAVVLPGGMPGASNLAASPALGALLKEMALAGKWVCAICASPAVVLAPLGLLGGKQFTCYPGLEGKVAEAKWREDRVVVDGNIITSRGPGTAGEFAAAIASKLSGEAEGKKLTEAALLI